MLSIRELATYAEKAYQKENRTRRDIIGYVIKKDIFVRIERHSETTVSVAFRGTDSAQDWFYNLSRWRSTFINDDIKVHHGFLKHMVEVYADIASEITRLYGRSLRLLQHVYVAGHSLGGAVSVLYGAQLCEENPGLSITVATFGAPRVGNKSFKTWCESAKNLNIHRVHNTSDIATCVPYFGYYHVGHCYDVSTTISRFWIRKNHSISTYVKSLEKKYM